MRGLKAFFSGLVFACLAAGKDVCTPSAEQHIDSFSSTGSALLQSKKILSGVAGGAPSNKSPMPRNGRKDKSTLFYHIHLPRTGGTTVANLLYAHICVPFERQPDALPWSKSCTKTCDSGLTDNAFACQPKRKGYEHILLRRSIFRARFYQWMTGARKVVYVTTLRRGSERAVSNWLYELSVGMWLPPKFIPQISNESLELYIAGNTSHALPGDIGNLQTSYLASPSNWAKHRVNKWDLRAAKMALMGTWSGNDEWIIGFSDCMEELNERLTDYGHKLFGPYERKVIPHISQSVEGLMTKTSVAHKIILNPQTQAFLESKTAFDDALYDWAWSLAKTGKYKRFTRTC